MIRPTIIYPDSLDYTATDLSILPETNEIQHFGQYVLHSSKPNKIMAIYVH